MFDAPYTFQLVGKESNLDADPYQKVYYAFRARQRRYILTFELFSINVVSVKFCAKEHLHTKNAYSIILNDADANRVIGTCFHIMNHYWQKNKNVNFVFYASLREIIDFAIKKKAIAEEERDIFAAQYARVRFRIYKYGMVNLFSYEHFTQVVDPVNCIYVLLNKNELDGEGVMTRLSEFLLRNYELIFNPDYEAPQPVPGIHIG